MSKHILDPRLHNERLIINHPKFRLLKGSTPEPNRSIGVADKPSDRGPGRKRQDMRIDRTEEEKEGHRTSREFPSSEGDNRFYNRVCHERCASFRVASSRAGGMAVIRGGGDLDKPAVSNRRSSRAVTVYIPYLCIPHARVPYNTYKYTRMYIVPARAHPPLMKSIRWCALCRGC